MMLTVDQARSRILDTVPRMPSKKCGIVDGLGSILAQSVYAGENIPPFDNSAMDGYALIASDVKTASDENPVTLDVRWLCTSETGEEWSGYPYYDRRYDA